MRVPPSVLINTLIKLNITQYRTETKDFHFRNFISNVFITYIGQIR